MKTFITELQDEVTSRLINNGVSEENINAVEEALENRTDHIVEQVEWLAHFDYGIRTLEFLLDCKYHQDIFWKDLASFLNEVDEEESVEEIWQNFWSTAREEDLTSMYFEKNR